MKRTHGLDEREMELVMMVAALVDRVTFNSQILNMNCTTSYRMETALNGQPARRT